MGVSGQFLTAFTSYLLHGRGHNFSPPLPEKPPLLCCHQNSASYSVTLERDVASVSSSLSSVSKLISNTLQRHGEISCQASWTTNSPAYRYMPNVALSVVFFSLSCAKFGGPDSPTPLGAHPYLSIVYFQMHRWARNFPSPLA